MVEHPVPFWRRLADAAGLTGTGVPVSSAASPGAASPPPAVPAAAAASAAPAAASAEGAPQDSSQGARLLGLRREARRKWLADGRSRLATAASVDADRDTGGPLFRGRQTTSYAGGLEITHDSQVRCFDRRRIALL